MTQRHRAAWTVVWLLPQLPPYLDRLRMLARMSRRVRRVYVLCSEAPASIREQMRAWPHVRLVPLGAARLRHRAHAWLDAHWAELDVVHDTFGFLGDWMDARRAGGRPRLFTTQFSSNARWLTGVRRRPGMGFDLRYAGLRAVTFWRDRRVASAVDRVLVLGVGHADDFREFHPAVPRPRFLRVPSEVDTERFTPPAAPPSGPTQLLYTGRMQRSKGLDTLLQGFAAARAGGCSEVRLRLTGGVSPMDQAWFDRAIAATGLSAPALEAPGPVPPEAMAAEYRRAHVFVSPSLFEGSPRSVREALACGCRAVLSDIPGHRALDPEGAFVRFVPVDDTAGWRRAIEACVHEPVDAARARSEAGVAHMRAVHSLQAVADRLLEVYAQVPRSV